MKHATVPRVEVDLHLNPQRQKGTRTLKTSVWLVKGNKRKHVFLEDSIQQGGRATLFWLGSTFASKYDELASNLEACLYFFVLPFP